MSTLPKLNEIPVVDQFFLQITMLNSVINLVNTSISTLNEEQIERFTNLYEVIISSTKQSIMTHLIENGRAFYLRNGTSVATEEISREERSIFQQFVIYKIINAINLYIEESDKQKLLLDLIYSLSRPDNHNYSGQLVDQEYIQFSNYSLAITNFIKHIKPKMKENITKKQALDRVSSRVGSDPARSVRSYIGGKRNKTHKRSKKI